MNKTTAIVAVAGLGLSLAACSSGDASSYQAVCTDPNTQQVVDPSYCNGGGSSNSAVWDYILLSTYLNNIHNNAGYYSTGVHVTNVHYHLPANSSANVKWAGRSGPSAATTVTTNKTGSVTKSKPAPATVFKAPVKQKTTGVNSGTYGKTTPKKVPNYGTPPKTSYKKSGKCC